LIEGIQQALKETDLDGWLFYSFRDSDPIAANILGLGGDGHLAMRGCFYLVPQTGQPVKVNHSIERHVRGSTNASYLTPDYMRCQGGYNWREMFHSSSLRSIASQYHSIPQSRKGTEGQTEGH
jgi:hypothetical protein